MDKGLQGVSIADDIYNGGLKGMIEAAGGKKENINIIGEYFGEFAEGVQTPLISAILAAHPDKKIDVVYTQGYCTTVVTAFKNAGLTYTPLMYCQNYNANALLLTDGTNNGIMNMTTNAGSIGALDIAYRMFMGEKVDKQYPWPTSYGVTKKGFEFTPVAKNVQFVMLERGVNAFPEYPPGFQPFWNWPGAYVQITVQEATGK
jgi:ABC-type sugar transport system substrate-binding protein